ncbi:MAG TPA: hypothetical protein VEA59_03775 [Patescibacteria group bacterium]|nr:hypothetical protein [Patescibacteria group bacterium]
MSTILQCEYDNKGEKMTQKINLLVENKEMTVYFDESVGAPVVDCFYCKNPGYTIAITIERIEADSEILDNSSALFQTTEALVKRELFHDRGICARDACMMKVVRDQQNSAILSFE